MTSLVAIRLPLAAAASLLWTGALFAQLEGTQIAAPKCGGALFTVDGSGSLRKIAKDLAAAICEAGLPIQVHEFEWSHGVGRVLTDLRNHSYHTKKGCELAECVLAFRASHPDCAVGLVAHSSGAAVVLAAAEHLPPGAVDRIILLAPAISPSYDLRPALLASVCGIDTFYSRGDLISRWLFWTGTADGRHRVAAGCKPFETPHPGHPDADLFCHLRHHVYGENGSGGHFACTRLSFFRMHVIPLLGDTHCP